MHPSHLSFLYQTRTLLRVCRRPPSFLQVHRATLATRARTNDANPEKNDGSIPFEWDNAEDAKEHLSEEETKSDTITPSEASVFQGIFEEIAQGRMPRPRRPFGADGKETGVSASSIVDQARDSGFRDTFLDRYPSSLRHAAEVSLGKFELAPKRPILSGMIELEEAEAKQMAEWKRYTEIRNQEKERVDALMAACKTDLELWQVMETEVFSLPKRLGIAEVSPAKPSQKRGRKSKKEEANAQATEPSPQASEDENMIMDVHGPLYPHYLATGLSLFDTAFSKPSMLAFNILPRVKALGLPSYVLGVSTNLFCKLAQIYWDRFGDIGSTVKILDQMKEVGLYADLDTSALLSRIRKELHACSWGAQGGVVMAMAELPPYDSNIEGQLEGINNYVLHSLRQQGLSQKQALEDDIKYEQDDEENSR